MTELSFFAGVVAYLIVWGLGLYGAICLLHRMLPCKIQCDEYEEPVGDASLLDRRES